MSTLCGTTLDKHEMKRKGGPEMGTGKFRLSYIFLDSMTYHFLIFLKNEWNGRVRCIE